MIFFGKNFLLALAFDQDQPTSAAGPQQRRDLPGLARHHRVFMKMLFEDLHYMTELKTCAGPAPGPTRTYHPFLIVKAFLSRKAPWMLGMYLMFYYGHYIQIGIETALYMYCGMAIWA